MNRNDIVARLATEHSLTTACAGRFVDHIFDMIEDALIRDEVVRVYGFGVFRPKVRSPRTGRNPNTGEPIVIPAKRVVTFEVGDTFDGKLLATPLGLSEADA